MRDIDCLVKRLDEAMNGFIRDDCDEHDLGFLSSEYRIVDGRHYYEFLIWCSWPDRFVLIGSIDLDNFGLSTYVSTYEIEIDDWNCGEPSWLLDTDEYKDFEKQYMNESGDIDPKYTEGKWGDLDWYYIDKYFPAEVIINHALSDILFVLDEHIGFEKYMYESLEYGYKKFLDTYSLTDE